MRILHFINSPFTVEQIMSGGESLRSAGGWLASLLDLQMKRTAHSLACCAFDSKDSTESTSDGRLTCIAMKKGWPPARNKRCISKCKEAIQSWKPDVVHIHGTEQPFGLLNQNWSQSVPAVISLQGLLAPCSEWYRFFGNRSLAEVLKMTRVIEVLTGRGVMHGYWRTRRGARRESVIFKQNGHFIGRTDWDHAFVKAANPSARYHRVNEPLREAFWQTTWSLEKTNRFRVIFTNAGHPRKGAEVLVEAVRLLLRDYPGIQLCLAGSISRRGGYGRSLRQQLDQLGSAFVELGPLNSKQMAAELSRSHVFVHPSFIDNSPNSLAEAQLIGTPVVATYTGGVSSLVKEKETGLLCPTGDAFMVADRIRTIFEDNDLAVQLSMRSRAVASARHNPDEILRGLLSIYKEVSGLPAW